MKNKYLQRFLVWTLLIVVLSLVTYNNYRIFIVNGIKQEIEEEKKLGKEYDGNNGKIQIVLKQIENYNKNVYDDNKFSLFIPDGYDNRDITLNYVQRPLLNSGGELTSSISITEEMPEINWSSSSNKKDIKGIKISIMFNIDINNLDLYLAELQNSVRLIYIDDFKYTLPSDNDQSIIKVNMSYYLFYRDTKTT